MTKYIKIYLLLLSLYSLSCSSDKEITPITAQASLEEVTTWANKIGNFGMEVHTPPNEYIWAWDGAVFIQSLIQMYEKNPSSNQKYFNYIEQAMIHSKDKAEGGIPNSVASACGFAFLYRVTNDPAYLEAAEKIYRDYKRIRRAKNGGVSHIHSEVQLWDDTIYMTGIFLLEMFKATNESVYAEDYIRQLIAHASVLMNQDYGLWYHGWDEDGISKAVAGSIEGWPDPVTHTSDEFWGRGNGWVLMSLADAISILDPDFPGRENLITIFRKMVSALPSLQDAATGHWYQLLIYPNDNNNFLESSCTAMFGYAIAKGINTGFLEKAIYQNVAHLAFRGIYLHSTDELSSRHSTPVNVSSGTSIGDKEYYYARPKVGGTNFAIGAYLMFGSEMQELISSI